jgi:hypothetical protein
VGLPGGPAWQHGLGLSEMRRPAELLSGREGGVALGRDPDVLDALQGLVVEDRRRRLLRPRVAAIADPIPRDPAIGLELGEQPRDPPMSLPIIRDDVLLDRSCRKVVPGAQHGLSVRGRIKVLEGHQPGEEREPSHHDAAQTYPRTS